MVEHSFPKEDVFGRLPIHNPDSVARAVFFHNFNIDIFAKFEEAIAVEKLEAQLGHRPDANEKKKTRAPRLRENEVLSAILYHSLTNNADSPSHIE